MKSLNVWLVAITIPLVGCLDLTGSDEPVQSGIVVSGTIQNNTSEPLPPDARLMVGWVQDTAGVGEYLWGEGEIGESGETFSIKLVGGPPGAALTAGVLGVGVLLVTTDQTAIEGAPVSTIEGAILGASPRHAIIWREPSAPGSQGWLGEFGAGYDVGLGVEVTNAPDIYVPTEWNEVVVIIDDLENLDFLDWGR